MDKIQFPADLFASDNLVVGMHSHGSDNSENRRLHIYFNHGGLLLLPTLTLFSRPVVEQFLNSIWCQFGRVTDTYYHVEISFGFVSFATHDEAARALQAFADTPTLRNAINKAVEDSSNKEYFQKMADAIFKEKCGRLIMPSWASPRRRG